MFDYLNKQTEMLISDRKRAIEHHEMIRIVS